jgi:coproporphyrinogen III oxidase-like Fe-S oxidoreductase
MLSERLQTSVARVMHNLALNIKPLPFDFKHLPAPEPGRRYMLYAHIPFCERLCPYCSFNRYPHEPQLALRYYKNLAAEMRMLADLGYDFESLYIGGGTPTVQIDALCDLIDEATSLFSITEVSTETNPDHLIDKYVSKLVPRVQRLSVGVQSFDDDLLRQMDRYDKYGSGREIFARVREYAHAFTSLNVDMIFNFPSQSEAVLINDLAHVLESGTSQTTFYPLMCSPAVAASLARTVGRVDYAREAHYYEIISEALAGGEHPAFTFGSAWTFNRIADNPGLSVRYNLPKPDQMIDEYIVDYEEYPAIGSGGFSFLGHDLYINTFSVREYNEAIERGNMSMTGKAEFNDYDRMRYRFMMQLFGLRLDKKQWQRDFGRPIELSLPAEYAFYKASGAFATDTPEELTLSARGRYMSVALMRQFFIGVNNLRDQARAALPADERELLFGC